MDHFAYRDDGQLWGEAVPLDAIAEGVGTPCYVYSQATLLDHYDRITAAFADVAPLTCFAMKSCSNLSIARRLVERGAGLDIVSGGELERALAIGADPSRCVYAGVGKTDTEICAALRHGVGWFNVESEAELANITRLAERMVKTPGVTGRAALRVNPDVDPRTHRHTTTGKRETKFGVDIERAQRVFAEHPKDAACRLRGVHVHLGSPVLRIDAYVESITKSLALVDAIERDGGTIEMLDIGGGFGADYVSGQSPTAADYAEAIVPIVAPRVRAGLQVVLEPGRTIAANAGVLLVRVLYIKQSGSKTFIICDGGMNTLMRPCHYDAFHFMWPTRCPGFVPPQRAETPEVAGLVTADVVGPICETGDFFARDRPLPPMERGDLLAVFGAGAYGMSMANRYNSMPLPPEVLIDGEEATVIRRRESFEDLVAHERNPEPLALGTVEIGA